MIDPRVDLVTARWTAFDEVAWLMPLLSELSEWRRRLDQIQHTVYTSTNDTDVVFIADFPGWPFGPVVVLLVASAKLLCVEPG